MAEGITYREVSYADIPIVTSMWACMMRSLQIPGHRYDDVEQAKFFATITAQLANQALPHTAIVAVDEDKDKDVVGFISGGLYEYAYGAENLVTIEHLYIKKEYRNSGIAKRLGGKMEDWAGGIGASQIEINIDPKKQAVWEKYGYRPALLTMQKILEED